MSWYKKHCYVYALKAFFGADPGEIFYYGSSYDPKRRMKQHTLFEVDSTRQRIKETWKAGGGIKQIIIGVYPHKAAAQANELALIMQAREEGRVLCNYETVCDRSTLRSIVKRNYILAVSEYPEIFERFDDLRNLKKGW